MGHGQGSKPGNWTATMAVGNTIGKLTAEPMLPKSTPAGSANPPEKKSWWSKWGDVVHTGLDILGAVPVVGIVADGANAAIYAAEGDYVNAAISGASAAANLIPGGGAAMKAGKAAVAVGKQAVKTVAKESAEALAKKAAKEAAEKAAKEAAEKAAKEGAEAAGKKAAKKAGSDAGGGVKGKKKGPKCKNNKCVGRPVNPLLGIKFLSGAEDIDFELPAPLALPWQRSYFSDQAGNGWLGQGWSLPLSTRLQRRSGGLLLIDEQGREIELPELDENEEDLNRYEAIVLRREANGRYRISSIDGALHQIFAPLDLDAADPLGERAIYLPLVAIEDRNFNRVRICYGDDGLPAQVFDSAGRRFGLAFGEAPNAGLRSSPRLRSVALLHGEPVGGESGRGTWPRERVETLVSYDYSAEGDLVRVLDGEGKPRREYAYRNHILIEHSQPGGLVAQYEYDQYTTAGKVLRHSTNTGQSWQFVYAPDETRVTDNLGRETRYQFNEDHELIGLVDPSGGQTRIDVNGWGKPTAVTDPSGRTMRYHYDPEGNLVGIVDAAGARTEVQYHERWLLPELIVDAGGAATRYDYDARGNLVRETDALGNRTSYNHDERGCVVRITDALGGRQRLAYDDCAQLIEHTDCVGNTTRYGWDSYGTRLSVEQSDGSTNDYAWDRRGRLLRANYADGGSDRYDYDALGRLVRHTNPAGHSTQWELAVDGLPLTRTDALGHRLAYQYDAARRLVVLTNENGSFYRYAYDMRDNVVGEQGFDGRVILYGFDGGDKLTERRELGVRAAPGVPADEGDAPEILRTSYRRDAAGRLVEKIVARARDKRTAHRRYDYDGAGRLASATSDGGRITLGYDELGRLVEEASLVLGREQRVEHRYDALGNRTDTLLPDGREITQRFYGPGYLDQISLDGEVISTIERDVMQRETVRSQGALTSYFDYDALGRRVSQRARKSDLGAQDVVSRSYVYDRAGNLQAMNDLRFGQSSYQYDVLGRLTRADKERFAFDPAHNLVESAGEAVRANRVVRHDDKQFKYDTHGNLIEKRIAGHSVLRFSYDPDHQLEAAEITRHGVVQKVSYGYDAFGRRSWKRDGFGTTAFLWHGDRLLQETRGSRCLTYLYEPDGFVPLAQVESRAPGEAAAEPQTAQVRYFHTDQVGTPRELSDSDGRISWRASYRAWGNTLQVEYAEPAAAAANEPVHQPLRFQGQYFDAETGLHYNRFRYYDPDIGRFVSQDPIGLAGGLNSYLYAPNPIGWSDPLGLACGPSLVRYKPRDELTAQAGSRQDAIDRAWALEKELLENGQVGTRAWSPAERNTILNTPTGSKPGQLSSVMSNSGYTGHHINSVKNNGALGTKWQGDPRNIVFLENHKHPNSTNMPNAYNEHFHSPQGHRGTTNNTSRGRLIDRQAMIDQAKRGCQ
jgi:RHS repeat-associated protein